jgi:hypothetical protein
MVEGVSETLKRISKLKTKADKVKELSKYQNDFPIKAILDMVYNPNIEFLLPETNPPYKPLEKENDAQNVLRHDVRKMIYFINTDAGKGLRSYKREQIFIEMLEAVDPDDAQLLLHVKNKKLPYQGITKDIVAKSFPGIDGKW